MGATFTGGLCPKGTCAPLSLTVQLDGKRFTLPASAYLRGDITAAPHLNTTGTLHEATRVWLAKEYPVIMMTLSQRSASDGGGAVFASVAAVDSIALARPVLGSWVVLKGPPRLESDILRVKTASAGSHWRAPLRLPLPPAPRSFNTPVSVAAGADGAAEAALSVGGVVQVRAQVRARRVQR